MTPNRDHMTGYWPCLDPVEVQNTPEHDTPQFTCDLRGCTRSFASKGNLVRHQKLHSSERKFPCPAQECRYSFTRKDKLIDHLRAGHEEETLFLCTSPNCRALLTRDVLPLHVSALRQMVKYRQCPLPKCSFRVPTSSCGKLQQHLLDDHTLQGRRLSASVLASKGYHYESADIICPMCADASPFETHDEFRVHVSTSHCPHRARLTEDELRADPPFYFHGCKDTSDALRKHRRTVLSLLSPFQGHPIWEDIKRCPQ